MASNTTVPLTLLPGPVPVDRQCPATVQDLVDTVCQVVTVAGLASQVGGAGVVPTNNTAAQALAIANQALTLAQANQSNLPVMRGSVNPLALAHNDSQQAITFSDIGTSTYSIIVTFIGPAATNPGAYFGWNIVTGSQSNTGCVLGFYGIPSGWSFNWQVITLTNTTAS